MCRIYLALLQALARCFGARLDRPCQHANGLAGVDARLAANQAVVASLTELAQVQLAKLGGAEQEAREEITEPMDGNCNAGDGR